MYISKGIIVIINDGQDNDTIIDIVKKPNRAKTDRNANALPFCEGRENRREIEDDLDQVREPREDLLSV